MPNQIRVLILLLLFPILANSQVARFMGRYDVSKVDYVADSTWQITGTFIDNTGSYTGLSCDTNDKIIQRGYDSLGRIVFDRYRITAIITQTVNDLVVNVKSDYTGGIQNSSNMPFTGSFPIASAVSDTSSLTYRTSMYQNLIDPDYDAALDNLNLYENRTHWNRIGDMIHNNNPGGVSIGADTAETNFTVDGSTNWIPVIVDSSDIDDGISISEMSRVIVYRDTNSAWYDWAYGSGAVLADGVEGQFLEIVSESSGILYLKNNEPTNTVIFKMSLSDNITLKYTGGIWTEWARTDFPPFFSCIGGSPGTGGITYIGMIGENGISVTPASITSNGTFTVRNTSIDSTFIKAGELVHVDSAGNTYTISIDSLDFITTITPEGLNSVMKIDNHTEYEYIGYEKVNAIINENNPAFSAYNSAMTPAFMGVRNDGHTQTDEGIVGIWGSGYDGVFDHVDSVFLANGRLLKVDSIFGSGTRKARIEAFAAEDWSATEHPTYWKFSVTDTLLAREAMRINRDRTVKLANAPIVTGAAPTYATFLNSGVISQYAWPTAYVHPAKAWVDKPDISGDSVISNLTIDALGHPTNWTKKKLTIPAAETTFGTVTSIGITAGTGISSSGGPITSSGDITVTNTAPESTSVANTGDGAGQVYKSMTGTQINLKTIKAGANVTVTNNTDDITIAASTGAGGNVKYVTSGTGMNVDSAGTMYTVNNITRDSTTITAGTGINVTGTRPAYTVTNSAPDQTVSLTQGGATTISGTYPNFTISSTDTNTTYTAGTGLQLIGTQFSNTAPDQTVSITGAGINVTTGTYPNFTITGTEVDGSTSNELQNLTYSNRAVNISSGTGTLIPRFSLTDTVSGLVKGSSNLGAEYFLNGAGNWAIPSGEGTTYSADETTLHLTGTTFSNITKDSTTLTAGTGIGISGTRPAYTVTNNAPDQVVSITGDGINVASGTYPNFTITGTEVDGSTTNEIQNLTYSNRAVNISGGTGTLIPRFSTTDTASGLVKGSSNAGASYFLNGAGNWAVPPDNNSGGTVTSIATTAPITGGMITTSGTIGINSFAGSTPGAVPTSAGGTSNYLRADGSWATPPDNNSGGTVTSIGITAGNGISSSGGPITSSGNITVTNTAKDSTYLKAGTGISLANSDSTHNGYTVTNSSPDQTVAITGAGINVASGTYPNFTVTGTEVDGSTTNEIQTPAYTASTRLIGLSGTATTAEIPLFATGATTAGLTPGSNSVGATYYLNGSGSWSVPATGALYDSLSWYYKASRNSIYTRYPLARVSIGTNATTANINRKLHIAGSQYLQDTLFFNDYGDAIWSVPDASIFTNRDFHADSSRFFGRGLQIWGRKLTNTDDFIFLSNDLDTDYDSSYRMNGAGNIFARGLSRAASGDTLLAWNELTGEIFAVPMPATGALTDSLLWKRNDTRGAMWTKYPDSVSINRIVPRKLFDVDGTAFVDDTIYISRSKYITSDADSMKLVTNMGWECTGIDVIGRKSSSSLAYIFNDVGFGDYDSAIVISGKGNMALGTLTSQTERLWVNGLVKLPYVGQSGAYDSIYVRETSTGRVKTAVKPAAATNYWSQSSGKLSPATSTDDIVATDSLRTEGAALIKNNLTVAGEITHIDSISTWNRVSNYRSLLTLDDDVSMTFFDNVWGHGRITTRQGATYAEFSFNEAGNVTLYSASVDVTNTDTDDALCIYPSGTGHIIIKNRLSETKQLIINIEYAAAL